MFRGFIIFVFKNDVVLGVWGLVVIDRGIGFKGNSCLENLVNVEIKWESFYLGFFRFFLGKIGF